MRSGPGRSFESALRLVGGWSGAACVPLLPLVGLPKLLGVLLVLLGGVLSAAVAGWLFSTIGDALVPDGFGSALVVTEPVEGAGPTVGNNWNTAVGVGCTAVVAGLVAVAAGLVPAPAVVDDAAVGVALGAAVGLATGLLAVGEAVVVVELPPVVGRMDGWTAGARTCAGGAVGGTGVLVASSSCWTVERWPES